ncbi:kinase-like domain-containing protein [Rhizophagus diaphanus]|nr:kinase-like domain-containing protein [Rhizophagus diaphanus] [Rhizophagus sp. MUCL 43196]
MDEIKLSDDVYEQIKDFPHQLLTEEQKSLVDKLITDKELKEHYKKNGLCENCKQPKTSYNYCQLCESQRFQQNFQCWTSENHDIDKFIQKAQLNAKNINKIIEWIDYDKFVDVEYLAEGGFGTTYKAVWKDGPMWNWDYENNRWRRKPKTKVALKCLHNSKDITVNFLKEVESNILVNNSSWIVRCFGITKDKTNKFMMVMDFKNGSLRQHLDNNFISLNWKQKMWGIHVIAYGLKDIHSKGLIHHDLHCGNILSNFYNSAYITDLGLCQPENVEFSQCSNEKIYGVVPYMAPEVLRGGKYTQASDIYGFGIIAYEICTGLPPYYNIAHDEYLAMKICQGLRPKSNYNIPQLIFDVINQCWDADPSKRSGIYEQVGEVDEANKKSSFSVQSPISYTSHPKAVYTNRLLDFKNLPEPKNADNNDGIEYFSDSLRIDFTKPDIYSKDEKNQPRFTLNENI